MDDQTRDNRVLRRLALAAALCTCPVATSAADRGGSSTQLHTIFRAYAAAQAAPAAETGHDASPTSENSPVIIRPRARVLAQSDTVVDPVITEADSMLEDVPPLPDNTPTDNTPRSLAELIRLSNQAAPSKTQVASASKKMRPSSRNSIRVEFAPQVHRIDLGSYDPDKTGQIEPDAVIRFIEPGHDEKIQAQLDRPSAADREESPIRSDSSTETNTDSKVQPSRKVSRSIESAAGPIPSLLPALSDPELGPMLESTDAGDADAGDAEPVSQGAFSARSRRVANIGGFQLLQLERLGGRNGDGPSIRR